MNPQHVAQFSASTLAPQSSLTVRAHGSPPPVWKTALLSTGHPLDNVVPIQLLEIVK